MTTTPNLGLPYIDAAQAQKHVTHNEAIRGLDALVQTAIVTRTLAAPPATPGDGACYILSGAGTGAWAGHPAGAVAAWQDGIWVFYAPKTGWLAWIVDEGTTVNWTGALWQAFGLPSTAPQFGINAIADSTNKLSVNSAAVLLNNIGNGVQLKLNKHAAADTASVLYQDNFSGRAETGLTGDDSYHFKVSPDGAAWKEALRIDATSGLATVFADPVAALGIATKQYVDTHGPAGPVGPQGPAGAAGPAGVAGATGSAGAQGAIGPAGATGAQGPTGPAGTNGNTVWNGTGAPLAAMGANGDFYLDAAVNRFYGPKAAGAWPGSSVSLVGPTGSPGSTGPAGPAGAAGPTGSTGPQGPAGPAGGTTGAWTTVQPWAATTAYVVGPPASVVTYQGGAYVCVTAHTSTASFDVAKFTQVAAPGATGPQGVAGITGAAGPAGAAGATGPQGPIGNTGPAGATGATGPQGTAGTAGAAGATGPQGPIGNTGPAGSAGATGATGAAGATGPTGPAGTNGNTVWNGTGAPIAATGVNGDFYINTAANTIYGPKAAGAWPGSGTSLVGPQGPAGAAGATGATGAAGAAGATGSQGPIGNTGPAGSAGATGATGPQGPAGTAGATGATGATGAAGAAGTNGNTVWNGTGSPGGATGANGDFYIDTAASVLYGPKAAGAWPGTGVLLTNPNNIATLGVNATADATNKLAVSSPAILFNNAGAGVQVKVNKANAASTASFLFQDAFSGRAEIGLTGDDNFHFKVSADGATWFDGLDINAATGAATVLADPTAALGIATKQYVDAHSGGAAAITEAEIDFGGAAVQSKRFTIANAAVLASSKIVVDQSGKAATGRNADENEMDYLHLRAVPAAGSFTLYAACLTGRVSGKFKINYLIG